MKHELSIDSKICPGTRLCSVCEILQPGLVEACSTTPVLIQQWANRECSGVISRLIAACPHRAIMVKPEGR